MARYLRNTWYVAAFSDDIGAEPFARTLLDEPIVFFRGSTGSLSALPDRCPHRFVPLSRGRVDGDELVCGYHGLRFNGQGGCTDTRFNDAIRKASCLTSYPIVERYGVIWIWMGDADAANADLIPDFGFLDDPTRVAVKSTTYARANYVLETDNLMDLSHLDYLHTATISTGKLTEGTHTARSEGDTVHSSWWNPDTLLPPQYRGQIETPGNKVDRWLDMRWDAPAVLRLEAGVCRVGDERKNPVSTFQGHFLTPETETTTWYMWIISRKDRNEPPESHNFTRELARKAFEEEDLPMIEAQQGNMRSSDFWGERPVIFPADAGAIRARRILDKLIRQEQAKVTGEDVAVEIAAE